MINSRPGRLWPSDDDDDDVDDNIGDDQGEDDDDNLLLREVALGTKDLDNIPAKQLWNLLFILLCCFWGNDYRQVGVCGVTDSQNKKAFWSFRFYEAIYFGDARDALVVHISYTYCDSVDSFDSLSQLRPKASMKIASFLKVKDFATWKCFFFILTNYDAGILPRLYLHQQLRDNYYCYKSGH